MDPRVQSLRLSKLGVVVHRYNSCTLEVGTEWNDQKFKVILAKENSKPVCTMRFCLQIIIIIIIIVITILINITLKYLLIHFKTEFSLL